MAELALDDRERDALAGHLDRVRVAELVWREASPDAGRDGEGSVLRAAEGDHGRPAVGPCMTHSKAPTGSAGRKSSHGWICCQPQRSVPTSRRLPPLPRRTSTAPVTRSRSLSASVRASLIRSSARQSTMMSARTRRPCGDWPAVRMTATNSSTVGGSAG